MHACMYARTGSERDRDETTQGWRRAGGRVGRKGTFLYSAVYSRRDYSKRCKLHTLADVLIPTPSRLLWEAFSHAAITPRRLFLHISTTAYNQVLIYTKYVLGQRLAAVERRRQVVRCRRRTPASNTLVAIVEVVHF